MSQIVNVKMEKDYPFGELSTMHQLPYKAIVTRKVSAVGNERETLIHKALILRQLQQDSVVQLHSYKEQAKEIQFNYQYVPIKFENWMQKITLPSLQKFQEQLFHFIYFLSYNKIIIRIRPSCIGLTSNMNLKYFLDFDFFVDYQCCKNNIFENYKKQVDKLCQLLSRRISTPGIETKIGSKETVGYQKNNQSHNNIKRTPSNNKSIKINQLQSSQIMKEEKQKKYSLHSKEFQQEVNQKIFNEEQYKTDSLKEKPKQIQVLSSVPDKLLAQARQILGISLNWRLSNDKYGQNLIFLGGKNEKLNETDNNIYNKKSSKKQEIQAKQSDKKNTKISKNYQDEYYQCSELDQSAYFDDFAKVLLGDSPKKEKKELSTSILPAQIKNDQIKNDQITQKKDIQAIQKKVFDAISNSVIIMQKFKQKKN